MSDLVQGATICDGEERRGEQQDKTSFYGCGYISLETKVLMINFVEKLPKNLTSS